MFTIEERDLAAVGWQKGPAHTHYEDRFRLLCAPVPLVVKAKRGEIFAVCDGVGSAPKGMAAAQKICDVLVNFFDPGKTQTPDADAILALLREAGKDILSWGMIHDTDRPAGACAATVARLHADHVHIFHAGDTCAALIREGTALALTRAHQDAAGHLVNYFGSPALQVEHSSHRIELGDRLLLTSDGITKVMPLQQMATVVESAPDRAASLRALLQQARASGSGDDMTALLIDVE